MAFQIVAVRNSLTLGFNVVRYLRIFVEIGRIDQIAEQLKELQALWFIVLTIGASTGIDAESMAGLNELVLNQVGSISGVSLRRIP